MKYGKLIQAFRNIGKYGPYLRSFRVENFKAIEKSGAVQFTPLTVIIGNNGSGKSSLIEGIETYRAIVCDGLDAAMGSWYGMGHIWNKRVGHDLVAKGAANETFTNPIRFEASGMTGSGRYRANMIVNAKPAMNGILIQEEGISTPQGLEIFRDRFGTCLTKEGTDTGKLRHQPEAGESAMPIELKSFVKRWQFLSLLPDPMGRPAIKQMAASKSISLNRDGSNLAQYLLSIRDQDASAFEGIVEAMQFVLDYARNFEPVETRAIQPTMYLQMLEQLGNKTIEIPSWLISTGTLRILALLAVLRHPEPPPLIVVEEIENGLDPRTLHLILEEIHTAVEAGKCQVILTTHSPYLLNLVDIQQLLLCTRVDGNPVLTRPGTEKSVLEWSKSFAPGQLYTMGRMGQG